MRPTWCSFVVALLLPLLAAAGQETRGNINGIVQDSGGVIPGAAVKITNTATSQTQQLVTNSSGYFEAVLLNPGTRGTRRAARVQDPDPERHLSSRVADL